MKVKICGITNLEDALDAIDAGADALGFVFYDKSPRYIDPFEARKIVDKLPPFIQTIGLFVNEPNSFINQVCINAKMQTAQIIDDDTFTDFKTLDSRYIKVLRAKSKDDIEKVEDNYVLVDAFVESFGGEGKRLALEWFKDIDCSKMILAGGLNADNLKELSDFNFYGVDVSSGVEAHKGKKDKQKMINFIKAVNEI
ncbi:phosphoribosylanthranilate isomerase [Poseidonibacter ostreae]|uniref:N-(5'-phosphoribosyl)anthranilate isomerase n=1 Tax=Poseidonibacter ostreae TaxID=2654171 RepID=A0A6L4WNP2_9BACT|nr:phosphoribosylanthranilate isomerase [Poseidonibacter ostreae]KAB7885164.1 phosphoribosylanthranilate isomerase [Poseidonibacter ostreae]MAC85005.1 N-(5'-phosphoribosyl)anthranilate isomerase [Arcobacter sp.]|tara:strand:+ start:10066 stop:10656 length:591 start_codon:yes stop_codon:yes gene_type:complete